MRYLLRKIKISLTKLKCWKGHVGVSETLLGGMKNGTTALETSLAVLKKLI